jgi:hypothetical protein
MALKTARTSLYFVDPGETESAGASVVMVGCVTNLSGIEAGRDQLENTCLEDSARSYEAGLATPGQATFTINFDPADSSHIRVYELWQAGTKVQWAVGLSDGPAFPAVLIAPTLDTSDGDFNLPDTRSWITFEGYISNVPLDLALNALVTANVTLQISDFPVISPKVA